MVTRPTRTAPVARRASMELGAEKYEVFLYLADERGERTYVTEHRFLERPEAETVKCLFYARNRVHHQWADALYLEEDSRRRPRRYPTRYFEWLWRLVDELPPAPDNLPDPQGRARYRAIFERQPADVPLQCLGEVFDEVWQLLEFRSVGQQGLGFGPAALYTHGM